MKKVKILFIFIILIFSFSFLNVNLFSNKNVLAEGEVITISSLSEITDLSGNYALQRGQTYEYSTSLAEFSGTLNGNGAIVRFNGTGNVVPLFESLKGAQKGAQVYNLCFKYDTPTELTFDVTTKTSYGLLAGTSINANVYGIELENINLVLNDNPLNTAVSTLNVGLLVGQVSGGKINQIKVNNCKISTYQKINNDETMVDYGIRANLNLGLLVGKMADGAKVQNNLITNCSARIVIANSEANSFNFGGVVGTIDSGFLTNNIVDFGADKLFKVEFARTNNYLNFGYLVGKTNTNLISLYNNIVNVKQDSLLTLDEESIFVGVMMGYMQANLNAEDVCGFLTTLPGVYAGNKNNSNFLDTYKNINLIENENLINSNIANDELWQNIYSWNFINVWRKDSSYIPTLQIFEEYSVSFSSLESVKSLSIENLPSLPDNEDVVNFTLSANMIPFGNSLTITASITNKSNFDKFFYITGLNLNGTKIYDIASDKSIDGYQVNNVTDANDNNQVKFEVNNFNAGNMGVYSVQLARKTYKLKIKVYELMVDEKPFIPGKVKNNMASEAKEELLVEMQYGVKYTYETYDVNSDYAKEADWYLTYETSSNEDETALEQENQFDLESAKTSFTARRTLSWTFDENCVLFGNDDTENDYLDIKQYDEAKNKIFMSYVVFTRDVKDIEIRFKFDDDEEILNKIAEVLIDDGAVSLTYKNGVYIAKIRYGTKPHTITLTQLSTDYTFDGWYLNSRLAGVSGDEYAGSFEILNDGETDTVVITAVFTKQAQKARGSLLWLWLTLGGVVLVGIVVTIIIIKKKKSASSAYKKYMY